MKKILLSMAVAFLSVATTAQTVYFEENFDDLTELPADWTNIDADGDGNLWFVVQLLSDGVPLYTPLLRSRSWAGGGFGALTPDNWAITPPIDLSTVATGETVELTYNINANDPDWDAENYTVYVGTSNDPAELENADITFNESTLDGFNSFEENSLRTIDVTSLAGQTIYVAFRHHDVSDQFTIELDNVKVASSNLGVNEVTTTQSKLYVISTADGKFKVQLPEGLDANKTRFEVYNLTGSRVNASKYAAYVDFRFLPAGVYILKATDGKETATTKFIKK